MAESARELQPGTDVPPTEAALRPAMTRELMVLFAVSCGVAVANLYYAQPVLDDVARSFGTDSGTAGLVVTFAQIGYACGLALLVPLGDLLTRRWLVPALLVATAGGLAASAAAPAVGVLVASALVVGTGSVAAQILVPMAAALADEERRGHVVGVVMSGLLLGILLARTVSGVLAQATDWRVVYVMAAGLTGLLAVVLARQLPGEVPRPRLGYGQLLASAVRLLRTEPVLQKRSLLGALGFGAFSIFWTTMAFLLAGRPYHYDDLTIGLFGLVGAAGALFANIAGRWADRGWTRVTSWVFAGLIGVSFLPLWWGRQSLTLLVVGILLLDIGVQGLQVTNQSLIYGLAPEARSRVNSAYMVCYFVGGALGSALGADTYQRDRWAGVCVLGAAVGVVAMAIAVLDWTRSAARVREPADQGSR